MPWYAWLAIAVIIAGFAAITGVKPKGTRPVAGTQLMTVARVVLLLMALAIAYQAFRAP